MGTVLTRGLKGKGGAWTKGACLGGDVGYGRDGGQWDEEVTVLSGARVDGHARVEALLVVGGWVSGCQVWRFARAGSHQ